MSDLTGANAVGPRISAIKYIKICSIEHVFKFWGYLKDGMCTSGRRGEGLENETYINKLICNV